MHNEKAEAIERKTTGASCDEVRDENALERGTFAPVEDSENDLKRFISEYDLKLGGLAGRCSDYHFSQDRVMHPCALHRYLMCPRFVQFEGNDDAIIFHGYHRRNQFRKDFKTSKEFGTRIMFSEHIFRNQHTVQGKTCECFTPWMHAPDWQKIGFHAVVIWNVDEICDCAAHALERPIVPLSEWIKNETASEWEMKRAKANNDFLADFCEDVRKQYAVGRAMCYKKTIPGMITDYFLRMRAGTSVSVEVFLSKLKRRGFKIPDEATDMNIFPPMACIMKDEDDVKRAFVPLRDHAWMALHRNGTNFAIGTLPWRLVKCPEKSIGVEEKDALDQFRRQVELFYGMYYDAKQKRMLGSLRLLDLDTMLERTFERGGNQELSLLHVLELMYNDKHWFTDPQLLFSFLDTTGMDRRISLHYPAIYSYVFNPGSCHVMTFGPCVPIFVDTVRKYMAIDPDYFLAQFSSLSADSEKEDDIVMVCNEMNKFELCFFNGLHDSILGLDLNYDGDQGSLTGIVMSYVGCQAYPGTGEMSIMERLIFELIYQHDFIKHIVRSVVNNPRIGVMADKGATDGFKDYFLGYFVFRGGGMSAPFTFVYFKTKDLFFCVPGRFEEYVDRLEICSANPVSKHTIDYDAAEDEIEKIETIIEVGSMHKLHFCNTQYDDIQVDGYDAVRDTNECYDNYYDAEFCGCRFIDCLSVML